VNPDQQSPRLIPPTPAFQTASERLVWTALVESLEPGEVLFHGLRFTDPKEGDVEIDLLLLSPARGAAIVEVKGGLVEFRDGEWTTTSNGGAKRRIRPVDQARRAKHALRRYLDRSSEWSYGLLRTQWFLALPMTDVSGDMGPEAPRDRIIGRGDVARLRSMVNEGLRTAPREGPVPTEQWVDQATRLLLDAPGASQSAERFEEAHAANGYGGIAAVALAALAVGAIAGSFVAILFGGVWGVVAVGLGIAVMILVGYRFTRHRTRIPISAAFGLATAAVVIGALAGGVMRVAESDSEPSMALSPLAWESVRSSGIDVNALECSTAYAPCVLEMPWDRNCDDIGFRVRVLIAEDPYGLDRDGDGEGCVSFPDSALGEGKPTEGS